MRKKFEKQLQKKYQEKMPKNRPGIKYQTKIVFYPIGLQFFVADTKAFGSAIFWLALVDREYIRTHFGSFIEKSVEENISVLREKG